MITASSARRNERGERVKTEDFDAEEGEMLKEENKQEEELFDQVYALILYNLFFYKSVYVNKLFIIFSFLLNLGW